MVVVNFPGLMEPSARPFPGIGEKRVNFPDLGEHLREWRPGERRERLGHDPHPEVSRAHRGPLIDPGENFLGGRVRPFDAGVIRIEGPVAENGRSVRFPGKSQVRGAGIGTAANDRIRDAVGFEGRGGG